MSEPLTVYTKNNCAQCMFVKMMLEGEEIPHTIINIEENEEAYNFLVEKNLRAMPVVTDGETYISGNRPDEIKALVRS